MKTPEHNNFTILRLTLALLVVFGHFATLPGDAPATGIFGYADVAVDMFFIVSGYLIFASFDSRPVMGSFYIRRLFRIYPLYLAVVLVQGFIMAMIAGGIVAHGSALLRYLALNLMMANFLAYDIGGLLSGLHNPGINPSLWTLKIEFAFYLLLPLLWYLTQRYGWKFLALLYAGSVCYVGLAQHFGLETLAKQLPGQMRFFAVGMALYYYRNSLVFPTLPAIAAAAGLFLLCSYGHGAAWNLPLFPLCLGLMMFIAVFRLPHVPLKHDISYGVYLLHGPLIQFSLLLGFFYDAAWFLLPLVTSVVLLALAAERFVEQPGIDLGKRLAREWNTRFGRAQA